MASLSRARSVLNESASEQIVSQAYYELFRYFALLIDFHERLETTKILELPQESCQDLSKIIKILEDYPESCAPSDNVVSE